LAFGPYSPLSSSNFDQTVQVSVVCTKGATSTVGLDLGTHASGSTRRMSNGTDFITYELYSDSSRTIVWGNASGSWVSLSAAPSNAGRNLTVYGRAPGSQDVSTGSYSDSVTVTVTY
jgi:spore coat protein U-like protein